MIAAVGLGFVSLHFQNKNCDAVFNDHVTLLMVNSLTLLLFLSLSLHDKLSHSDCDGWTSSPREDLHF